MLSTVAPKNSLLPGMIAVRMRVDDACDGLVGDRLYPLQNRGPQPGSFVSTSVTPLSVMNTAVLPPLKAVWSSAPDPVMM